jgi:hypothetical protein
MWGCWSPVFRRSQQLPDAGLDIALSAEGWTLQFWTSSPRHLQGQRRAKAMVDRVMADEALERQNDPPGAVSGQPDEMRARWLEEQAVHEAVLRAVDIPVAGRRICPFPGNTG